MSKRYGLVIDLERCIGCHTCAIACKVENAIETGSAIRVETIGGSHPDTPAGVFPKVSMYYLPIPCMHCDEPPCRDVCPAEAIYKREDGIVLIDSSKCDGCQACMSACPYEALFYDNQQDTVRKCTLCAHRLDEGLEPFCVRCCEGEAMYFGDLNDPQSQAAKLVAQPNAYILKPERGTNPAIHYLTTGSSHHIP